MKHTYKSLCLWSYMFRLVYWVLWMLFFHPWQKRSGSRSSSSCYYCWCWCWCWYWCYCWSCSVLLLSYTTIPESVVLFCYCCCCWFCVDDVVVGFCLKFKKKLKRKAAQLFIECVWPSYNIFFLDRFLHDWNHAGKYIEFLAKYQINK